MASTIPIPASHKDLFEKPVYVVATTVMKDGQPQSTVVWADYDGEYVRINTVRGRQKDKNLRENPKITIVAVDPQNPYRWIEVRGTVEEMTEEGAVDHIESLSRKYNNGRGYYGDYNTRTTREQETRVTVKIRATHVLTFPRQG